MLADLLIVLAALVLIWVIASFPAYIGGKIVTGGKATFGQAMGATLGGVVVYGVTAIAVAFLLDAVIGPASIVWGVILGFVAFLAVYRAAFETGWIGAFAIAVLSVAVVVVLNMIVGSLFGVSFPAAIPHKISL